MKRPLTIGLLVVLGLLGYSNWRTAKQRDDEHRKRLDSVEKVMTELSRCSPSVFLKSSNNPVDAVQLDRYRDNQNGHVCVFLPDGRYGDLWWSIIIEGKEKGHLEWNFTERGKYTL